MDVTVHGLKQLRQEIEDAQATALDKVARVTGMACNKVKKDWQARWRGYAHIPHLPRAINYEVTTKGTHVHGVVGPRKDRQQGGLGSYIELGTPTSGPIPGGIPAHAAEEPIYLAELAKLPDEWFGRG